MLYDNPDTEANQNQTADNRCTPLPARAEKLANIAPRQRKHESNRSNNRHRHNHIYLHQPERNTYGQSVDACCHAKLNQR